MSTDPHRSDRLGRRAGSRIAFGILVGPLVGGALGLLIGSIVFGTWSRGMWAAQTPFTEESHPGLADPRR